MSEFLTKLKNHVISVLSVIATIGTFVLFGWWALKRGNKDGDQALAQNEEDKKKLADLDKKIEDADKQLADEAAKREEIKKNLDEVNKDVPKDDLVKYFNDPNNKPS